MKTFTFATIVAALLAGCQTVVPIRPEAFDKGQRGAILLLHAHEKISMWAPAGIHGPQLETAPVLAELRPVVVEAMARNPHFRLVPEARVFAAPSYAALAPGPGGWGYISPPPYKSATSESLYPVVAREVGADMAMGLMLILSYRGDDGAAMVGVNVGIIGADGKGIWTGGAKAAYSDLPIDVTRATPQARIEAFKDATRKAMANLEKAMTDQLAAQRAKLGASR